MSRRALGLAIVFFAAVMLVLGGCAQKRATDTESADMQQERTAQAEAEREAQEQRAKEEAAAEEDEVEEYGVSDEEEEDKETKKPEERELSEQARKTLKERVHFAFDSSELSQEAQDVLKDKAKILKKHSDLRMAIAGHCDERGTDEYNMALGERRARAAYEYLILLGVDADRMDLVSYGEERPLVEGSNEKAWAKNRRDEFKIKQ